MVETTCPAYSEVENVFEAFIHQLTQIQDSAQQQLELFKEERAKREWNINKSRNTAQTQKKITLDIGGTVFRTTEETLLSKKDTFFSGMLSADWQPDPDTGAYFIDRGATMFPTILEYLRTGEMPCIDGWTTHEQTLLQRDLDFYSLNETVHPSYICWENTPPCVFDRAQRSFSSDGFLYVHIPAEVRKQNLIVWTLTIAYQTEMAAFFLPCCKHCVLLDLSDGTVQLGDPTTKQQLFVWDDDDHDPIRVKFILDQQQGKAVVVSKKNSVALQCGALAPRTPYFQTSCFPACTIEQNCP
eukprot:TRINITY_DN68101_c7_g2_i6.p1 TRINITY_DN68101_c7_g2~~TRINITY_DN68101_c7_g2_i6.p1  ORF type:complete len:299 (-),score=31.74 TRINITY_DN68101_c7_g2_i6:19-915(-)